MATRFTDAQIAILHAYRKKGMVGIGKSDQHLVMAAAKETGLNCKQVKVRYNVLVS